MIDTLKREINVRSKECSVRNVTLMLNCVGLEHCAVRGQDFIFLCFESKICLEGFQTRFKSLQTQVLTDTKKDVLKKSRTVKNYSLIQKVFFYFRIIINYSKIEISKRNII